MVKHLFPYNVALDGDAALRASTETLNVRFGAWRQAGKGRVFPSAAITPSPASSS